MPMKAPERHGACFHCRSPEACPESGFLLKGVFALTDLTKIPDGLDARDTERLFRAQMLVVHVQSQLRTAHAYEANLDKKARNRSICGSYLPRQ